MKKTCLFLIVASLIVAPAAFAGEGKKCDAAAKAACAEKAKTACSASKEKSACATKTACSAKSASKKPVLSPRQAASGN